MSYFLPLLSLVINSTSNYPIPRPVQGATWSIDINGPSVNVSPSLYGIFFEEINCAGDGGLYAEMVRNRGFEDSDKHEYWALRQGSGEIALDKSQPLSAASPTSLKINAKGEIAVENAGYWGYGVQKGDAYQFSTWSRGDGGNLKIQLVDPKGKTIAQQVLALKPGAWTESKTTLKVSKTEPRAKLVLGFDKPGTHNLDMVSLFPKDTWKGRPNGLRSDLANLLNELKPAFVRFPGGCWVEGETMALAQRWKQTIGDQHDRRTQPNIWKYMSTNGLGYHEYLQMCEDLNSDALFVINCGMSHKEVVPMAQMDEYVQDALDAIEYATGPTTSKWGAIRAKNGHPKPFNLKYIEIGNENGGPAYAERYALIYNAIKSKYPAMNLIACVWGGYPSQHPIEIIDEHYYNDAEFFVQNADRYDNYDRKGPKVYVGEYAVTQNNGNGSLKGALGEAVFMTGMERNSDVVTMSSYAPLFANVDNKAWNPDLIYFDSSKVAGTPSYYVQKMFFRNRPDISLKSKIENVPVTRRKFPSGGIGVGGWGTQMEYKDIKVTQGSKVLFESADGTGLKPESGTWAIRDGAYVQTGSDEPSRAYAGDASWNNYTVTLKAKKLSGNEGFMISVGRRDKGNYIWWNIGGWNNTQHAIEVGVGGGKSVLGDHVRGKVETGRWYDVKVEYTDDAIKCYLDGKLIQTQTLAEMKPVYGVAGFNKSKTEAILKVVNVSNEEMSINVDLSSTGWSQVAGTQEVLTGGNTDENTIDNPNKVVPKGWRIVNKPSKFQIKVGPRSLNVFRLTRA